MLFRLNAACIGVRVKYRFTKQVFCFNIKLLITTWVTSSHKAIFQEKVAHQEATLGHVNCVVVNIILSKTVPEIVMEICEEG